MGGKPLSVKRVLRGGAAAAPGATAALNERAGRRQEKSERRSRAASVADVVTDPDSGLTDEQRAAISRGDAPPIARLRRRRGAALATKLNGDSLG